MDAHRHRRRCSPPSIEWGSTDQTISSSTTIPQIDVDLVSLYAGASKKGSLQQDSPGSSDRTSGPLAFTAIALLLAPRAVARGCLVDLSSEMQVLEDYAEAIISAAEDKSVEFVKALNKAVCFGAACHGDRVEILALCSFKKELTQLKEWAEQLSTIVEAKKLIEDLTRALDVLKVIQLSQPELAGVPPQPRKS